MPVPPPVTSATAPPSSMADSVQPPGTAGRPSTLPTMPLTLEETQTVIARAHAHAAGLGVRVAVAVVDEGGLLQALARMDGCMPLSSQIAEAKAVGAALMHRDGDELRQVHETRPAFFAQVDRLAR